MRGVREPAQAKPAHSQFVSWGLQWLAWDGGGMRASGARASDHWVAVARGQAYLRQNRPDLALQAVFDIRDEGPGAGEAMTIAGPRWVVTGSSRAHGSRSNARFGCNRISLRRPGARRD